MARSEDAPAEGPRRVGRHQVEVSFGHCDPARIVFYPNYFRWFDQAAWAFFAGAGLTPAVLKERYDAIGWPAVDVGCTFHKSSKPGDRLTIETTVERWGRRSFTLVHRVLKADGELAAEGREVRVWAGTHPEDPERLRALPVPEEVIRQFGGVREERGGA